MSFICTICIGFLFTHYTYVYFLYFYKCKCFTVCLLTTGWTDASGFLLFAAAWSAGNYILFKFIFLLFCIGTRNAILHFSMPFLFILFAIETPRAVCVAALISFKLCLVVFIQLIKYNHNKKLKAFLLLLVYVFY